MSGTATGMDLDVATPEGAINVCRFEPSGSGPWPAVFLLMDAPGIRPELHRMAARIAGHGYLVWLPNLYWRIGRDVSVGPTRHHPDEAANRERMFALIGTLGNRRVVGDVERLIGALEHDAGWNRRPIGITGYCMSGRFAVLSALELPGRVACAASYFGTRLVTEDADSPHLRLAATQAELYFAFAEHDPYVPPQAVQKLRAALAAGPVRHHIETYPGTEHGFVFSDRGSHHDAGEARHWQTLFELFERHLGHLRHLSSPDAGAVS